MALRLALELGRPLLRAKMVKKNRVLMRFAPTAPYSLDRSFNQLSLRTGNNYAEEKAKLAHTINTPVFTSLSLFGMLFMYSMNQNHTI